ncbi:MAG: penicillin acylase family protein [Vicinamibacterales bacterium]|nr:penicillin acylase family protein [Vicinamibacterales bacterium]
MQRAAKIGTSVALTLIGVLLIAGLWAGVTLRASLPTLDGEAEVAGLSAPVRIERDALGIPTIRGASRADVAHATGFLHAQDRYFQMDLARRRAAGELAELVGDAAVEADKGIRIHRLTSVAADVLTHLSPADHAVLASYVAGVNAGLLSLGARPPEYLLLRQAPRPWTEQDSILVILSMFVAQQDSAGAYESMLAVMQDVLPEPTVAFLSPRGTEWDSPVVGDAFQMPATPGPEVYNPREHRAGRPPGTAAVPRHPPHGIPSNWAEAEGVRVALDDPWNVATGSNNFAVSGAHTPHNGALLADDMHFPIRVPNTWYRAAFEWPGEGNSGTHRLDGVTLPGVPTMVAGSNTHIAWGFTTTYGDYSDIVLVERDAADPSRYRTPGGLRALERHDEIIRTASGKEEHLPVEWTIWGPLLAPDHKGRTRAIRWIAHDAARIAAALLPMETARTLDEGLASAGGSGTPAFNQLIASRDGRIAWTVYGSMPRRTNVNGREPSSWADGSRGWEGHLTADEHPRVVDPVDGRLWTANARVVDGAMLELIGDGSYEIGSRARIIRERLRAKERFEPRDLLAIQLDDSALFLERWRALLLGSLASPAASSIPKRATLRGLVERDWQGRALPGSAGYRFTRAFRDVVSRRVFAFLLADCREADPRFDYTLERKREGPLWTLVTERPLHFLDPAYASWEAFLLAAVDAVIDDAERTYGTDLSQRTWGEVNRTRYRHPLSAAVPLVGRWLDMPEVPVPGDLYTPRMAYGADSASERFVVSPGREAEGIMHMPTGQSGHPFSPHYGDSHPAWIAGAATPFLPGPAVHTLTLRP